MAKQSAKIVSDILELEKYAVALKSKIKDVMPRRPIVIEFGGSPRSGKTQSISSLSVFLRRNKFKVFSTIEYASINPISNKFDPWFNVWTGCMSLCKLLETVSSKIVENDFILIDRGIFDAICWIQYHYNSGRLTRSEYEAYVTFFNNSRWASLISLVYIFRATPQVSLEREYAYLLTRKAGSVMQDKILNSYNDAVQECITTFGASFSRIEQIDTSHKDQNEVGYIVTKKSLEAVSDVLEENIAYFNLAEISFLERGCINFSKVRDGFPKLNYDSRINVEANSDCIQPIAIGVVRSKDRKEILTGVKLQKAVRSRSPEINRTLCWFGGHVRSEDMNTIREKSDYISVIKEAARREIKEELDLDVILKDDPEICIWDQDSESGRRHIAFVFDIVVDFSSTKFHADAKEFSSDHITLLSQKEFYGRKNVRVDSWGFLILREILKWKSAPIFEQTEFKFR